MNVLIVCSVGMSSSAIVKKLRDEVQKKGLPFKVGSCSVNQLDQYSHQASVILLSPHTIHVREELVKKHPNIKIEDIPMKVYGNQDIEQIIKLIERKKEQEINEDTKLWKMRKVASYIGGNKIISSINDGMMGTMAITIIGSILILMKSLPFPQYTIWLKETGLDVLFQLGVDVTIGLIAIHMTYLISYHYARKLAISPISASLNALVCFFIMINRVDPKIITEEFLGSRGIFYAIFTAIVATRLFAYANKKTFKMRQSLSSIKVIPVFESLSAIYPTFVCVTASLVVVVVFQLSGNVSLPSWFQATIQNSLDKFVGNNIFSDLILISASNVLWFFGIHGGSTIGNLTKPLYSTLAYANIAAYSASQPIPYIITSQFKMMYVFGGAGSTLGLAFLMARYSKSQQLKKLGKISLPLGIFFINEPIMFGLPIVFNPMILIPYFVIAPTCGALTYFVMKLGIIPYAVGFDIPWTTPPVISGFIQGGLRLGLWQLLMIFLSTVIWYPFFKQLDKIYLEKESTNSFMPSDRHKPVSAIENNTL